jgi:glycosyltransferase involved in cell wall biosynthesis
VGLYCGSLYLDKRLELLVAAADLVQAECPDFRLAVLGDGPSQALVSQAAATRPWLHALGVQRGIAKAGWFRASQLFLSPGAVGLQVLDAFCAGLPLITTDDARHGPEMAYLVSGRNGVVTKGNPRSYADGVLRLLRDPALCNRIRAAAAEDALRYTLERMVERFVAGVERCLAASPKP